MWLGLSECDRFCGIELCTFAVNCKIIPDTKTDRELMIVIMTNLGGHGGIILRII